MSTNTTDTTEQIGNGTKVEVDLGHETTEYGRVTAVNGDSIDVSTVTGNYTVTRDDITLVDEGGDD